MSLGGDKGGSSQVELPEWWETAARENLQRANIAAQMGPNIWTGPSVAAASPLQQGYFGGAAALGDLAGITSGGYDRTMSYLPQAQSYAGGVSGYSAYPMVMQNMQMVDKLHPGLMDSLYELYPALAPEGWQGTPYDWDAGLMEIMEAATYWDAENNTPDGGEVGGGGSDPSLDGIGDPSHGDIDVSHGEGNPGR